MYDRRNRERTRPDRDEVLLHPGLEYDEDNDNDKCLCIQVRCDALHDPPSMTCSHDVTGMCPPKEEREEREAGVGCHSFHPS